MQLKHGMPICGVPFGGGDAEASRVVRERLARVGFGVVTGCADCRTRRFLGVGVDAGSKAMLIKVCLLRAMLSSRSCSYLLNGAHGSAHASSTSSSAASARAD